MPTSTYDLIEEKVLSSGALSVTFSSIPGTYKDLALEVIANSEQAGSAVNGLRVRLNSDTGNNYYYTGIYGDGSATGAYSAGASAVSFLDIGWLAQTSATYPANNVLQFQSYANTNVKKTVLSRFGTAANGSYLVTGLWNSTAAITSIQLYRDLTNNVKSGSVFRLWGLAG